MMIFFDSIGHRIWVSEDCINLYSNGFDYIWKTPRAFLSDYVARLKNQLIQMWRTRCKNNVKLSYTTFIIKQIFKWNLTLHLLTSMNSENNLVSFRSSSNELMIEKVDREF